MESVLSKLQTAPTSGPSPSQHAYLHGDARKALRQRPIIYTTPVFFKENDLGRLKGEEFWLRSTTKTPAEAYPGQDWHFWQYTSTGVIDGIDGGVDINLFNGSRKDWQNWLKNRAH